MQRAASRPQLLASTPPPREDERRRGPPPRLPATIPARVPPSVPATAKIAGHSNEDGEGERRPTLAGGRCPAPSLVDSNRYPGCQDWGSEERRWVCPTFWVRFGKSVSLGAALKPQQQMLLPAAAAAAHCLLPPLRRISSLKVPWRRDAVLDAAINRDRRFRLASRLVREVLLSPGHRLLLRYLSKRRHRIRLPVLVPTFLRRYPTLLSVSPPPNPFASPSPQLLSFLEFASRLQTIHSPLLASKLAKLLMISSTRALPVVKIAAAKRDFGLPDDFLVSLVPRYPDLFRLVGDPGPDASGNAFLELASWDDRLAKSVIELRADREADVVGIRPRPNFTVKLPKGFYLKKEMREWVRDWLELPYVSPYADTFGLHPASPEAEKRLIGVLHEVLSLSVERRMAVPIIGKFCEEFRLSNAFSNAFTRHPGIFYVSLKGGIKTVVLREAYDENGELVDRDPMIELKERFVAIMDEGHREYLEELRRKNEQLQKERADAIHMGAKDATDIEEEEDMEGSEEDEDKEYDYVHVESEEEESL